MIYQIIFLPFWVINCSQIPQNNTEVFITYAGHSDAERIIDTEKIDIEIQKKDKEKIPETSPSASEDIVFIPNEKPVFRNEDSLLNVQDVVNSRRVGDLMRGDVHVTEKTNQDVLFITGKNNENIEKPVNKKKSQNEPKNKSIPNKRPKNIDCTNLDCNNTIKSICGGKQENNQWKYRLFLNDCYFRKVNCGFQHVINRYELVSLDKCKNIGGHYPTRPDNFKPIPIFNQKTFRINEIRRSLPSRRSLSMGVDGAFCEHTCPVSCTEGYDPQCAVSNTGQRKVFLNHCKLDQNSCVHNVVWYRRPLSECVGGKKADMNQNRGFISWMQRVGIIDRNGRLVLS